MIMKSVFRLAAMNEERFSLGGAAYEPPMEALELVAAPVSEKRVGLNRSPGRAYGH